MNYIFEFIEKPYSLRKIRNSGQRIQTTIYGIETEKYGIESFSKWL